MWNVCQSCLRTSQRIQWQELFTGLSMFYATKVTFFIKKHSTYTRLPQILPWSYCQEIDLNASGWLWLIIGAPHLRSAGRKLNYFQYHSYDVILTYLGIISTLLYLIYKTVCYLLFIFRRIFSSTKKAPNKKKIN